MVGKSPQVGKTQIPFQMGFSWLTRLRVILTNHVSIHPRDRDDSPPLNVNRRLPRISWRPWTWDKNVSAGPRSVSSPHRFAGTGWKWVGSAGKAWFSAYVWWLGACFGNFTKLKEFFFKDMKQPICRLQ